LSNEAIRIYTQISQAERWVEQYRGKPPVFACVLGFTATGLIPGISAAGATPDDRQYTAIADAEFLYNGPQPNPKFPLPPLHVGASPALISRAVISAQTIPLYLFNAGLPHPPAIPAIDLGGKAANCLSTGQALPLNTVEALLQQGLQWGQKLAEHHPNGYLVIGECVVGGTTTALAILTGLGIAAQGKVNSSHPTCNHQQKWQLVQAGLEKGEKGRGMKKQEKAREQKAEEHPSSFIPPPSSFSSPPSFFLLHPLKLVAAVGDPMQIVVAGMTIAASQRCGVLLAGGTQMLAVYALARAIAEVQNLTWQPTQVVVGTTRWVAEDATGDTVGLAETIDSVPLLATQLNFTHSRFPQFQAYEQGYVKEGVGAGGCAIAAHLYQNWSQTQLLDAIETLAECYLKFSSSLKR
jgi:NaMN:DMB phosphoribosyltransferase